MKKRTIMNAVLSVVLSLSLLICGVPVMAADQVSASFEQVDNDTLKVSAIQREDVQKPATEQTHSANEVVRVSIVLEEDSVLEAGYSTQDILDNSAAMKHLEKVKNNQKNIEKKIAKAIRRGMKTRWNMGLVANIISADVAYGDVAAIEAVDGVSEVVVETQYFPCETQAEPNMLISSNEMTGVTQTWEEGYTGAGARIAIIDTGLDLTHQSFNNDAFLYALGRNAAQVSKETKDYVKAMNPLCSKVFEAMQCLCVKSLRVLCEREFDKTIKSLYMQSLNLLDEKWISRAMKYLNAYAKMGGVLKAADVEVSDKIPFAFNYVDQNTDVSHLYDAQTEHGSHVAGIAAANRYIKTENGYADALDSVYVAGNAPDAQVLVMKVFGQNGGAYDSDYMIAIEDAILLGCDSVNLSLGSPYAGSTTSATYQDVMERLIASDTVVVLSAGNSGAWADNTTYGSLYSDDVNYMTGGSPGSFTNGFTVASVANTGMIAKSFTVSGQDYSYTDGGSAGNLPLTTLASEDVYDYVFVDGIGEEADYDGIDLTGKVVFCRRGSSSFYVKANIAVERGAIATIVYNNVPGTISMNMTGYEYTAPCVSILERDAALIRAASEEQCSDAGATYYTGKIKINADVSVFHDDSDHYTMSDFTSWGVPGDLSLKPEISAPGGNIYSVAGTHLTKEGTYQGGSDQYELMSGTSMAAPQISGMAAVLKRYIEDNCLKHKWMTDRALVQSLLMSTATPMTDEDGTYYSVMQQGAGLANVNKAIKAATYVTMGKSATPSARDGKVKAELGDDPQKKGVYTFDFTLTNLTKSSETYALSADVFTQYTDGDFLYGNTAALASNVTFTVNGKAAKQVKVDKNKSASVQVRIALSAQDKQFLDASYKNGAYIEAYIHAQPVGGKTSAHSIPVLAFYGNWTDASMYDRGSFNAYKYGEEALPPYLYEVNNIYGNAYTLTFADQPEKEYYFGGNLYEQENAYHPERNALNNLNGDYINSIYYTLIRNTSEQVFQITDANTGAVYASETLGERDAAFYYASEQRWMASQYGISLNWKGTDAKGDPLPEGTDVVLQLVSVPEYYTKKAGGYTLDELGAGASFSMPLTIDNTAPVLQGIGVDSADHGLVVLANDNEYIAALALYTQSGQYLVGGAIGESELYGKIVSWIPAGSYLLQLIDYAGNASTWGITLR